MRGDTNSEGEIIVREKILQVGLPIPPPQSKTSCVNWINVPNLDFWNNETHTECIGHKIEWRSRQWSAYLEVDVPTNVNEAVRSALEGALAVCTPLAIAKAKGTFIGTPLEIAGKTAAALAAAYTVFQACMVSGNAIASGLFNALKIRIATEEYWGDWG
jgi:hypothetical protein